MLTKTTVSVICAECEHSFETKIFNLIDGEALDLKTAFMQDMLNQVSCPSCKAEMQITTPILYFNRTKPVALLYIPRELELTGQARNDEIKELTDTAIPLVQPYPIDFLHQPEICESFDEIIAAILKSDGITEEILKTRSQKVALIDKLLRSAGNVNFADEVKKVDGELDRTFFEVLTGNIDVVEAEGDEAMAGTLHSLRRKLAKESTKGKSIVEDIEAARGNLFIMDHADCLDKMLAADGLAARRKLVSAGYQFFDERLFNMVTARINAAQNSADEAQADRLRGLRSDMLTLKHAHEKETQAAMENAEALFKSILKAKRPEKVLERKIAQVDESFFFVLGTNIARARSQGEEEAAQALETLGHLAVSLRQDHQGAVGR